MKTITLEPHWEGMRSYVLNVARTDAATALLIAANMGSEAPTIAQLSEAVNGK